MATNCVNESVGTPWTLAEAIEQLAARLDDSGLVHWTFAELQRYLVEALRTLQACTQIRRERGTFATQVGVPFYDLPTELPTLRGYHVTDRDLITDIEYALMEPPTPNVWTGTEQFTLPLITEALQSRLQQFRMETGIVLARSTTPVTLDASGRFLLPNSTVTIRRAAWIMDDGTVIPLKREDEWAMTHFSPGWPANPIAPPQPWPTGYSVGTTPPLTVQLAPAPLDPGTLDLIAVETGPVLDPANSATLVGIPDDWTWVVKFGALAELLSRDGLAYDPNRAAYAEARYRQGVQLAQLGSVVLQGYLDAIPGILVSLAETDLYRRNWQTVSGVTQSIMTMGQNLVGLKPKPNSTNVTVGLDVVVNMPIPVDPDDCLVVNEPLRDAFLDYAQHLALVKEGPSQLEQSMGLFDRFMRACGVTVKLDRGSVPDRKAIFEQQFQDERVKPRVEPSELVVQ